MIHVPIFPYCLEMQKKRKEKKKNSFMLVLLFKNVYKNSNSKPKKKNSSSIYNLVEFMHAKENNHTYMNSEKEVFIVKESYQRSSIIFPARRKS